MKETGLTGSDKQFWHRFVPFYEAALQQLDNCERILEFGVFKGESIRWLLSKYPGAKIFGSDILDLQPQWPIADNVRYLHVDQGIQRSIQQLFDDIGAPLDLIIEDGSHLPEHQKNCLIKSFDHLRPGGIYILEDIHTSHPSHPYYQKSGSKYIGPLHLLLCFEHLMANNKPLDDELVKTLSAKSLFAATEIKNLFDKIAGIQIFKRASLPHKCYACGSTDFDYHKLKCTCGVDIYGEADSMTAIITSN